MASIVVAGALSHSPLINKPCPPEDVERVARFRAAARELAGC
jgi:hypothetical protein